MGGNQVKQFLTSVGRAIIAQENIYVYIFYILMNPKNRQKQRRSEKWQIVIYTTKSIKILSTAVKYLLILKIMSLINCAHRLLARAGEEPMVPSWQSPMWLPT